jgi:ribosomal-protein-alanine N-acetyltransferase
MTEENCGLIAKIAAQNLAEAWSESVLRKQLENPNDRTYLATVNGTAAGFLSVWYVLGELEINNIAVNEDFRRQGVAKALLSRMESDFPEAVSCVLEVRESNSAAQGLYEKFGFVKVGVRKGFYSKPAENAVIMRKDY